MTICPNCGSDRCRRGGTKVWNVYLLLILFALVAVLGFQLDAGIVAAIVLAGVVLANLLFDTRVCLDCGTQWRSSSGK